MKVWHDPLLTAAGKAAPDVTDRDDGSDGRLKRRRRKAEPTRRTGARIIAALGPTDPRELERERLLERVLLAEGRPSISAAAESYLAAGFSFPRMQDVWLQLLEHNDEERVAEAIEHLSSILDEEEPQRRKVLESRLRRIEELAEMPDTQQSAANLRRMLHTRYAETLDPTPETPLAR